MKKTLSIILSFCFIISLFACISGLPVYAIDNTPEPQAVTEKIEATESYEKEAAKSEEEKAKEQEKAAVIKKQTKAAVPTATTTTAEKKNDASGKCGDNLTWKYDASTYTLTISGTGDMSKYSSSLYNGGNYVTTAPWRGCYITMKTLVINSGVTSISSSAFEGCNGLKSITIPDSVTSIGSYAFNKCIGLTSVTIPNSVTSIDYRAFANCTGLKNITIPDSVTRINKYALCDCIGLKTAGPIGSGCNIEFGWTISIPEDAFPACNYLKSITIPDSITSIGSGAFSSCSSLEEITLPFVGDQRHTSTDTYLYPFGYIFGTSSYTGGTATEQYYYGSSNSSATRTTYYIPSSLKKVTITDCDYIPDRAFYNCTGLTSITIGNSVKSIGWSAFWGCTGLTSITIPDSVKIIDTYAFRNCTGLTSVTIGNSVTSIGGSAFWGCTNLTSITIPDSVTSIGNSAFGGCSSLEEITLPFIGDKRHTSTDTYQYPLGYIFGTSSYTGGTARTQYYYGSSNSGTTYTTYYIPSSLKKVTITDCDYIPYGAFCYCTGLTSVTIGNSVTSIGDYAFYKCTGLTSITIPDSVTSIGEGVFSGCTGLTKVNYTGTIADWCNISFGGYSANPLDYAHNLYINNNLVTDLVIPDTVKEIKAYAFYCCKSLKSITISDSITSIGVCAFYYCTGLTRITIPGSVTSIGSGAFDVCTGLKTVYFLGFEEDWGKISIGNYNDPFTNATKVFPEECGANAGWMIVNNILYIKGSGATDTYKTQASVPWYSQKDYITEIQIDSTIANIGTYSFYCLDKLKTIRCENKDLVFGKYAINTANKNIKVYGIGGGKLEQYCKDNGIEFIKPTPQAAQKPTIKAYNGNSIEINTTDGVEYSLDTVNWQDSGIFTGLNPVTKYNIYARIKETDEMAAGETSEPLTVKTTKLDCDKTPVIAIDTITNNKITISTETGAEYSLDKEKWNTTGKFTGLNPGAKYNIYARFAETDTVFVGSITEPVEVTTLKNTISAPAAPDYEAHTENSIMLKPNSKYEFSMDGENWQKSNVFTNLSKNTIYRFYQRFAETDTEYVSTSSPALITAIPDKPKVINTSIESITVRQIEGFEYCLDDMVWQKSNVFDMLIEDMDYYVYQRIAAIPGEKVYQITSEYTLAFAIEPCVTHTYNGWEKDKNGHWQKCARCGEMTTANSHTFGKWTVVTPATCTNAGKEKQVCTICGYEETRSISATGHKLIEKVDNKYLKSAATCTQKAVYYKSCSVCGEKSTETFLSGNALGHDYKQTITPPTCTNQGYTTHTCSRCNDSYKDTYTDKLAHTPGEAVKENIVPATCTTEGSYDEVVYCTECNTELTRETKTIKVLGHEYGFDSIVWDGFTAKAKYVCSHDGNHVEYHEAEVTDEVTTKATCTEAGVRTYTAAYDGHTDTKTDEIKVLGHEYKFASFEWDGFTAKAKYVCDHDETHVEYYNAEVTNEVTTKATCTEAGVRTYTAAYDGHTDTKTDEIKALGHDWQTEWSNDSTHHWHMCSRCDEIKDKAEHIFGEWIETKPATGNEMGERKHICSVCGYEESEEFYIPGNICGDDEKVTDKDATYLLFHLFFPEEYKVNQSPDFNGDGKKDVKDVIHLLYHIYFPKYYKLH